MQNLQRSNEDEAMKLSVREAEFLEMETLLEPRKIHLRELTKDAAVGIFLSITVYEYLNSLPENADRGR